MTRVQRILLAAVAFCVFALAASWWAVSAYADRKARMMLGDSREFFVQMVENSLDSVLWYAGVLAAYRLDYSPTPRSVEEMRQLADVLYVDELTVVGTNGIAVASNYGEYVGFDWHTTPETAAYLTLLDPQSKLYKLMQPFRPCVIRHENYRKFGGVVFTNRLGFVQVGYSMERLVNTLAEADTEAFGRWKFGRYGRFGGVDRDGDGIPDPDSARGTDRAVGEVDKLSIRDDTWHRLTFPFAGRLFYAEVPDREFGDQRNAGFALVAAVIVLIVSVFAVILVRLQRSSEKLEQLHREADARTAADLLIAHTIQMSSLPNAATFHPGPRTFGLDAVMLPAREVGGDFYDFFALADGRIACVVGDVSGKGVPAAMFMLMAKNAVRQALHGQDDPARAMADANETLCQDNQAQMFVTIFLAVLDPFSGEVAFVNAGHNRPFVVRADGAVERLDLRGGRFLGLFPGLAYRVGTLRLGTGDRLFLYTDGVTEAQNATKRLYGEPRLRELLASRPHDLCAAVREDVARHVADAPASDDLTLLVLNWRGRSNSNLPPR